MSKYPVWNLENWGAVFIFSLLGVFPPISGAFEQPEKATAGSATFNQGRNAGPVLGPPSRPMPRRRPDGECGSWPRPVKRLSGKLRNAPDFCAAIRLVGRMENFHALETKDEALLLHSKVKSLFTDASVPGVVDCNDAADQILRVWSTVRFVANQTYIGFDFYEGLVNALETGALIQSCKLAIQAYPKHYYPWDYRLGR